MSEMCGESRSTHRGRHPSKDEISYNQAINKHLRQIGEDFRGGVITEDQAISKVQALQAEIRAALASGRFERVNSPELAAHIARLQL